MKTNILEKIHSKERQTDEKINNLAFNDCDGMRFHRIHICANHLYGEYDRDAQCTILRIRDEESQQRVASIGTRRNQIFP